MHGFEMDRLRRACTHRQRERRHNHRVQPDVAFLLLVSGGMMGEVGDVRCGRDWL